MQRLRTIDGPIVVFGLIALAALIVSAPATYNLVALYHNDGSTVGVLATVALLIILELGAVAAKLATLWVRSGQRYLTGFTLAALGINTLSNFIHGGLIATARGLHWAAAWLGALVYAALLPALVYLMLHLICERVQARRGLSRTVADQVADLLHPVALAVETAQQAQRSLALLTPLALPEASYPRPQAVEPQRSQPVLTLPQACPACEQAASPMQLRTAAQHGAWRCKGCGKRVAAQ